MGHGESFSQIILSYNWLTGGLAMVSWPPSERESRDLQIKTAYRCYTPVQGRNIYTEMLQIIQITLINYNMRSEDQRTNHETNASHTGLT